MKRYLRELRYDLQEPGINIGMIPLILIIFILYAWCLHSIVEASITTILSILELILPFLGGYASLMLMQCVYDIEGCELIFTFPRSNLYWGLIRQIRLILLYVTLIALVTIIITNFWDLPFLRIFTMTFFQCFAVMGVSFCGITLTKKTSIGLIVLVAFIGVQITLGREFDVINWIFILNGTYPTQNQAASIAFRSFLIGTTCYGIGQLWVVP